MLTATIIANCSTCRGRETQRCLYALEQVQHLRCESCASISAFRAGSTPKLLEHGDLTETSSVSEASAYGIKEIFTAGQLVAHSKFGLGYVLAVLTPPKKMDVLFEDKRRTLLCGPGSATTGEHVDKPKPPPAPKPKRPRKKAPRESTASSSSTERDNTPVECPKCRTSVHPYNLRHSTDDKLVGCMHCL